PIGKAALARAIAVGLGIVAIRRSAALRSAVWAIALVVTVPLLSAGAALPYGPARLVTYGVLALVIAGLAALGLRDPAQGLFLASTAAIVVSAPFILPDGGSRTLAVTVPFVAFGLAILAAA